MARTRIRRPLFIDPLLRKGHAHNAERYVPTVDEELEEWLREEDERMLAQQHEMCQGLEDEDNANQQEITDAN